jgi:hypothetical protein
MKTIAILGSVKISWGIIPGLCFSISVESSGINESNIGDRAQKQLYGNTPPRPV